MDLSTELTSQMELYPEEFTQAFFEESSKAWMLNKKRYGASYAYVCGKPKCKNRVKEGGGVLCKYHQAKIGIRETPHIQVINCQSHALAINKFFSVPGGTEKNKGFDSKPMNEWLDGFRALEY